MDTIHTKHGPDLQKERPIHARSDDGSGQTVDSRQIDPESGSGLRRFAIVLCVLLLLAAGVTAATGAPLPEPTPQGDATQPQKDSPSQMQQDLRGALEGLHPHPVRETAQRFYEERDFEPAWLDRSGLARNRAMGLLEALSAAGEHGLDPAAYGTADLRDRLERVTRDRDPSDLAQLDVALTGAFLGYGRDLLQGRLSPDKVAGTWHLEARDRDLAQVLQQAVEGTGSLEDTFRSLEPPHERYEQLQEQYRRYRHLADQGGWPSVPDGPVLEEGDEVEPKRYRALVKRLEVEGYLSSSEAQNRIAELERNAGRSGDRGMGEEKRSRRAAEGSDRAEEAEEEKSSQPTYDGDLAKAVREIQDRYGILEDGKVGPNTTLHLNVPAEERAQQIALNLERWRWLPADLGRRHVEVNLPGFTLRSVEDGRVVQKMGVVIGKEGWATPILTEQMERVVVNPYWNIPDTILHADLLSEIREDPAYLESRNMEVIDKGTGDVVPTASIDWAALPATPSVRVRERPSPHNALGQIKFLFPNEFNVYLHDTPADAAFDKTFRNLSHGCVRLERPYDFAGFVFENNPQWTPSKIRQQVRTREHKVIEMDEHLPVHFLYWTAFVDEEGRMNFRPDVYGYDEAHKQAVERQGQQG